MHTHRPNRPSAPDPAHPGRRAVLLGAAGLVGGVGVLTLTGCGLLDGEKEPEQTALDGFLASTAALADQYDATLAANPDLGATLTPLRDAHRAHVVALAAAVGLPTPTVTGAQATTGDRSTVMSTLAGVEKIARDEAVAACLAGTPRLAGLLGSIAAARASHLEVLK